MPPGASVRSGVGVSQAAQLLQAGAAEPARTHPLAYALSLVALLLTQNISDPKDLISVLQILHAL